MIPPSRPGLPWSVPGESEGVEAGTWNGSAQLLKYVDNGVIGFESVLKAAKVKTPRSVAPGGWLYHLPVRT